MLEDLQKACIAYLDGDLSEEQICEYLEYFLEKAPGGDLAKVAELLTAGTKSSKAL